MFQGTGKEGEVRVGYQVAVVFAAWTMAPAYEVQAGSSPCLEYRVTAIVARRNDYWDKQRPQTLALKVGKAWWTWPIVSRPDETSFVVEGKPTIE